MESVSGYVDMPYKSRVTKDLQVIHGDDKARWEQLKQRNVTLIGTHSDVFHTDEVLATTMLLYTFEF